MKYKVDARGVIQIESKEDIKKRLGDFARQSLCNSVSVQQSSATHQAKFPINSRQHYRGSYASH